jgi:hypothetical protein
MNKNVFDFLYDKSKLPFEIPFFEWYSKSVKTCPDVVGRTVRWDIHCYECGEVIYKQVDTWGSMTNKRYEWVVCDTCRMKECANILTKYMDTPDFEI